MLRLLLDFSPSGWGRVAAIAVGGTLFCMVTLSVVDIFVVGLSAEDGGRELTVDILLPVVVGLPLFFGLGWYLRRLAVRQAELQRIATTDSLTAVLNRGAFTMLVDAYLNSVNQERSARRSDALLIVDADYFKVINDRFGHDRGDEALKIIAQSIRSTLRSTDLVGRIGGEEFGVFLRGLEPLEAAAVAQRICATVGKADFMPGGEIQRLSVSVGGVIFNQSVDYGEIYRLADQELYRAKNAGRNRASIVPVMSQDAIASVTPPIH